MKQTLSQASLDTMSYTSDNNTESAAFSSTPTTSHSSPEPYPQGTVKGMSNETLSKGSATVANEPRHNYQDVSPDLLQNGFYNSQSLKDHAKTIRKSLVMSDSMASVAIHDHDHGRGEKTGIAMTNSPSFSALASILEKKQVRAVKPKTVLSPNLIELDEDEDANDTTTPTIKQQEPVYDDDDIFKTPEVKQQKAFPPQPLTEPLPRVDEGPEEAHGDVEDDSPNLKVLSTSPAKPVMDKELPSLQRPAMIVSSDPTSLQASQHQHTINNYKLRNASQQVVQDHQPKSTAKQTPGLGQHYSKRASSMPVLVDSQAHNKSHEKKRSLLSFFKKRSVSGTDVPHVNKQQQHQQHQQHQPQVKKMASSQSFQIQSPQAQAQQPRAAQRSTSSTSVFSAFRRAKKPTFEIVEEPQFAYKQQEQTNGVDEDAFTKEPSDDNASFSSDEGFNEDFNKLKVEAMDKSTLEPLSNAELEKDYETKRSSQISQGETLFPRKLSAHDVESIVSLERNRSQSRHSIISRRHSQSSSRPLSLVEAIESNAREAGMHIEQGILRPPSTYSLSTSIQQSPKILDAQEGYNDDGDDDSFHFEDFSNALEFDDIADQYIADNKVNDGNESPYDDNDVSDLLEFSEFIDFGGDLELNFDLDDDSTPLSQPPLNSSSLSAVGTDAHSFQSPVSLQSARFSNKAVQSPNTSPFIPDSAFVPSMSRPISMSFRGLKAPTLNRYQDSGSTQSFGSSNAPSVNKGSKTVEFSSKITLYDVYAEDEYDRKPDIATCNQLTPQLAQRIRVELNELKSEMEVHEDSRCYTHFF